MNLDENFKFHGKVDVARIAKELNSMPESAWLDSVAKIAPVHRQSRGVFLVNDLKPEHLYGTVHFEHRPQLKMIQPLVEKISRKFPASYLIRAQFSRHLPGDGFDPHHDRFSYTLTHSHRLHIAIQTNKSVWFSIGDEKKNLGKGEIWEINNVRTHAGRNEGSSPRIHLILDFAVPIWTVADRVQYFANLQAVSGRCGLVLCRPALDGENAPADLCVQSDFKSRKASRRVELGTIVSLNYTIKDAKTGQVLARDLSDEPLSFVFGKNQLPPKFESRLKNLEVGSAFSFSLMAQDAFGKRNQKLALMVDAGNLPEKLKPGSLLWSGGRMPLLARVHALKAEKNAVLDLNHPFAGRTLQVEGRIHAIRHLTPDEHRYAVYHGPSLPSVKVLANQLAEIQEDVPEFFPGI